MLHPTHVRTDDHPIMRIRAQIGRVLSFKPTRPTLIGLRRSEMDSDNIGLRWLRAPGASVSCRSFQDALDSEAARLDPWEFIRSRTVSKPTLTDRPTDRSQESEPDPWAQRIFSWVQKLAGLRDRLAFLEAGGPGLRPQAAEQKSKVGWHDR